MYKSVEQFHKRSVVMEAQSYKPFKPSLDRTGTKKAVLPWQGDQQNDLMGLSHF